MSRRRAANLLKDPYAILRRPVLTEKTHSALPVGQETGHEDRARYTFDVHVKATKPEIRRAIESAFGVRVSSVSTMIVKPRRKVFRGVSGKGSEGLTRYRKKAIVRLAKGSKVIDLI